jgi:2-polyprenyl-6-hydroxyphenyl methylase / 3-demethylubiquinone-9 3-methyltransferase
MHVTLACMRPVLPSNDIRLYDVLADEWWRSSLAFAGLRWIAAARAALMPPAARAGAVLVDLGCGGGLLAPHVAPLGYRHIGVDLSRSALGVAARHGVVSVLADAAAVPLADGCADVVSAGEILEHVSGPSTVVSEACRLLRPGGTLVIDTVNATALARFLVVTLGERVTRLAPRGLHDPGLFVRPDLVRGVGRQHGVALTVRGVRPAVGDLLRWLVSRRGDVRFVPTSSTAVLYQAWGVKEG